MRPSTTTSHTALWGGLALLLGAVGCHQTGDGYDKRWLLEPADTTIDFGAVELPATSPVKVLTLRNTGRDALRLGTISSAALGVDTTTFAFLPSASSCESGAVLSVGEACTLAFTFTPASNTVYRDTLEVSWTSIRDRADREETFRRALYLVGEGDLDCSADPVWSAAWTEGKDRALAANTADYDRGYTSGQARDYDDGHRRGYDAAYAPAYDEAYTYAYERAYGTFYDEGYDEGWFTYADTYRACQAGRADGWADGSVDGDAEGARIGWDDGDYDGVNDGANEAWDLLDAAAGWGGVTAACDEAWYSLYGASSAEATSEPPPSAPGDAAIAGLCEDAGFAEHRDLSAHDRGFSEGLRDNADYQAGLREGQADGASEGTVDGTRNGTRDGRQHGFDDGAVDGKADAEQLAYDDCYDAAYPSAYGQAYDLAYVDSYWAAYDQAFAAEYDAVMADYYVDAECDAVLFGS